MDWTDPIEATPDVLGGKPRVKGTRLSVDLLLRVTAAGWTTEQSLDSYPHLTDESLRAVYGVAADVIGGDARPDAARPS